MFKEYHDKILYANMATTLSGMFVAHLNQLPGWEKVPGTYLSRLLSKRLSKWGIYLALLDTDSKELWERTAKELRVKKNELVQSLIISEKSVEDFFEYSQKCWGSRLLFPTLRLFAVCPISDDFEGKTWLIAFEFLVHFVALAGISIAFALIVLGWNPYISIHTKITFLFLYTAAIPLNILIVSAQRYFSERREYLEKKILTDQERALLLFDEKYSKISGYFEPFLKKGFQKIFVDLSEDFSVTKRKLEAFHLKLKTQMIRIVNSKKKVVFSTRSMDESISFAEKIFSEAAESIFQTLNKTEPTQESQIRSQVAGATGEL